GGDEGGRQVFGNSLVGEGAAQVGLHLVLNLQEHGRAVRISPDHQLTGGVRGWRGRVVRVVAVAAGREDEGEGARGGHPHGAYAHLTLLSTGRGWRPRRGDAGSARAELPLAGR